MSDAARLSSWPKHSDNALAYLRRRQPLLFFEPVSQQRFPDAHAATRRVSIFKAAMQALVAALLVAVAIARQLSDGLRNFPGRLIRLPCLACEILRRQCRRQAARRGSRPEKRRHSHRRRRSSWPGVWWLRRDVLVFSLLSRTLILSVHQHSSNRHADRHADSRQNYDERISFHEFTIPIFEKRAKPFRCATV
jgi:hypothetical protein